MKTLISIMAHAAAEDTFKRHMPYWLEHKSEDADILIWSPENGRISIEGYPAICFGKAEHHGEDAIKRFKGILNHLAGLVEYEQHVVMEYDSFILGRLPALKGDFAGNIFHDDSPSWLGKMFSHPPFMVEAGALRRISTELNRMPNDVEQGMWDRALGLAIERARVVYESWITTGYGFSANTIQPAQFPDLRKAILKGSHALHGVKTPECLREIQHAWAIRHHVDACEAEGYTVIMPGITE